LQAVDFVSEVLVAFGSGSSDVGVPVGVEELGAGDEGAGRRGEARLGSACISSGVA